MHMCFRNHLMHLECSQANCTTEHHTAMHHVCIPTLEYKPLAPWHASGAITSGELTHRYLLARPNPWWQQLGRRCIHITWSSRGTISLEGLDLQV